MFLNLNSGQILDIVLAGAALGFVLILVEYLKRHHQLEKEGARKAIHIAAGIILAILPLFMTRRQVAITNFSFFGGVWLLSGVWHVFTAVHAVRRWTIGEYLYPLGTGLVALLFTDLRVYAAAVLILAFSDGLAGLLGRTFGGEGYKIVGGTKTILGNAVFFTTTLVILATFWWLSSPAEEAIVSVLPILIVGSLLLTTVEAALAGGFDNLAVPLAAAWVASLLL
jgi:phytol kinase